MAGLIHDTAMTHKEVGQEGIFDASVYILICSKAISIIYLDILFFFASHGHSHFLFTDSTYKRGSSVHEELALSVSWKEVSTHLASLA